MVKEKDEGNSVIYFDTARQDADALEERAVDQTPLEAGSQSGAAPPEPPLEPSASPFEAGVGLPPVPDSEADIILQRLAGLDISLGETRQAILELKQGQHLLADKMLSLSKKLDDAAISLGVPRIRDMLSNLLLLHDLLFQMAHPNPSQKTNLPTDHERNYGMLLKQIEQILTQEGIREIATNIPFNPEKHRAVECIPTREAAENDNIDLVYQKGFETPHRVLRYANVRVKVYQAPEGQPQRVETAGATASAPERDPSRD